MARTPTKIKRASRGGSKINLTACYTGKSQSATSANRSRKLGRSRNQQHHRSKASTYYGEDCASESTQAFMDDARMQHAYYTMIVETSYGEWRYASISDHGMGATNLPILFSASSLDKLLAIWERVVIHNAIPWHDSVLPQTLRVVSYSLDIQDVTKNVLGENYDHLRKTAALMMIEDKDARLLGLTEAKAKQVLFHNPEFEDEDEHLLRHLGKESTSHAVENLLVLD